MVTLDIEDFGTFKNEKVKKFTWRTTAGVSVSVITYGAIIQSIKVPDRYGVVKDLVLGFDDLTSYVERNTPYLGAIIGRCANRIGGATFEIDDVTYNLAKNVGENHLHGGLVGFDKVNWQWTVKDRAVTLSYHSKDGEDGYPGDVITNVTYELTDEALRLEIIATTTKKTVVNLTNHSYFNLAGHDSGAGELYEHVIVINADKITETDADLIPTGRLLDVAGTPFDLRVPTKLGDIMNTDTNLFDDNFCVTTYGDKKIGFVSRVVHPSSGRTLEIYSDQPGVQLYTSGGLPAPSEAALVGKAGVGYRRHGAFCLELQNYPDAIHHANFPTAILSPGEVYTNIMSFKFGVEKAVRPSVVPA